MKRRTPLNTPERSRASQAYADAEYISDGPILSSPGKLPKHIIRSASYTSTSSNSTIPHKTGCMLLFLFVSLPVFFITFYVTLIIFSHYHPYSSKETMKGYGIRVNRSMQINHVGSSNLGPTFQLGYAILSKGAVLDKTIPFIHIVNSRFQQHDKNLTALAEVRLQLFETFCLPSMINQTIQPVRKKSNVSEPEQYRFIWIIKVDPKLDVRLRNRMVKLLRPYPNFYLIGSNKNYGHTSGAGVSWGSWRGGKAGNDALYGRNVSPREKMNNLTLSQEIYTGETSMLLLAQAQREEKIILETRLDADDGLPLNYLEKIQESAAIHLSSKTESLSTEHESQEKLASIDASKGSGKLSWMFWCIPNAYNWHPTDLVDSIDQELSRVNDSGLMLKLKNNFCLTPGLTSGISVGVTAREVPRYSHYVLMKELRKHKNKYLCGNRKKERHCIQVLDDAYAVRARTPTSDGMSGVAFFGSEQGEKYQWDELFKIFGIREEHAILTNHYINDNLIAILRDNLAGQCSHLKGKLCKASQMAIQTMIEKALKARGNRTEPTAL